jgi:hypothetical protein
MDDYDDHAEAMAAEEEQRIEDDWRHEQAVADHPDDLERSDDAAP